MQRPRKARALVIVTTAPPRGIALAVALCLAIFAAAACGGAASRTSGSDDKGGNANASGGVSTMAGGSSVSNGGTSSAGANTFEPGCFDISATNSTCTHPAPLELANAFTFGEHARFRQLGGRAALLDPGDGQPPRVVVALEARRDKPQILVLDVDTGDPDLAVQAVYSTAPAPNDLMSAALALACGVSGCRLLAAKAGDTKLVPVEGFDLPSGARVSGLSAGRSEGVTARLCAFGEGLFCLGSAGWEVAIPPQISGTLTAVAIGTSSIAVSEDGELFVEQNGVWTSHTPNLGNPVTASAERGFAVAHGSQGTWYFRANPLGEKYCPTTTPLLLAFPSFGRAGENWRVVLPSGQVFIQAINGATWCEASNVNVPLLAASAEQCSASNNILAISDTSFMSLLGTVFCALD